MGVHEQISLNDFKNYLTPSMGLDGEWRSSGGLALQQSLRLGSHAGAMEVLESMDVQQGAACLREVGFTAPDEALARGLDGVLDSIRPEFDAAIAARVDGFGLMNRGLMAARHAQAVSKPVAQESELGGFAGAATAIQRLMRADSIQVSLHGPAKAGERSVLQFIGGQALHRHIQGFGFDGIPGKFEVPVSLPEMSELYRESARAIGEESTRLALGTWAAGGKVNQVHEWVPDSVQKMLQGSVSMESATNILNAVKSGAIGRHASGYGVHGFANLLAEQGYDVNAKTIAMQAEELGLEIVAADRQRSLYVGPLVGSDHRAGLVKYTRKNAVELPYAELPEGMERPKSGDRVRLEFRNNEMNVSVARSAEREGISR